MKLLTTIIGLVIVLFAWFNPFSLDILVCVAIFIIGFDMMGIAVKVIVFVLSMILPFFGDALGMLSWTLVFVLLGELLVITIGVGKQYKLFIKPLMVFVTALLSIGFQPALIVAGTDLLINMTHKIRFSRKKRK